MIFRFLALLIAFFYHATSSSVEFDDQKQIFGLECALRNAKQNIVEMCILSDMVPTVDKISEDLPETLNDYADRVITFLEIICLAKVQDDKNGSKSPRLCLTDDEIKESHNADKMNNLYQVQVQKIREDLLKNIMIVLPIYEFFEIFPKDFDSIPIIPNDNEKEKLPLDKNVRQSLEKLLREKLQKTIATF